MTLGTTCGATGFCGPFGSDPILLLMVLGASSSSLPRIVAPPPPTHTGETSPTLWGEGARMAGWPLSHCLNVQTWAWGIMARWLGGCWR